MNETLSLEAQKREQVGRHGAAAVRKERRIPAVIYGHGSESQSISVDQIAFERVYAHSGESALVNLIIDGAAPVKVLVQKVQLNPLSQLPSHIDFHQVRMDEKIHAEVILEFTGVAPAVKELGGTLIKNMDHVQVSCLPSDLPHEISIDVSTLKTFDDSIRVQDIPQIPNVEFLHSPEESIATVTAPRTAEELDALNEAVVEDVASVEVTGAKPAEETTDTKEQDKK